jgi:histidinol-phosphatase (PHP family)
VSQQPPRRTSAEPSEDGGDAPASHPSEDGGDDPASHPPEDGRFAQDRDLPLDAHLHTDLSPDSDVPIDAYAAQAVERGIAEIAITDHVDFDPRYPAYAYADFETRERVVREAADRWSERDVAIRFGVEITYQQAREDAIREHLARYRYDFVIGSVHIGPDDPYVPSRVAAWCAGRSIKEIVEPYFGQVLAAARSGLFDSLGHLDFVKRYVHPYLRPDDFARAPDLYEPILRALVEGGTGLEINTSGLRQQAGETYPSGAVVHRFRELGGDRVSVGSDAHRKEAFAFGLAEGYRHANDAGIRGLTLGRTAERPGVDARGRSHT